MSLDTGWNPYPVMTGVSLSLILAKEVNTKQQGGDGGGDSPLSAPGCEVLLVRAVSKPCGQCATDKQGAQVYVRWLPGPPIGL